MAPCRHCGSRHHAAHACPILAKVKLMEQGVPPEALFPFVVEVQGTPKLRRRKRRAGA